MGSGPNGLAAAITLAEAGRSVLVLEASDTPGGGTRTSELTLPGYLHDECSAVHPMGILSPYFKTLALEDHGLVWRSSHVSVAHPLEDRPAPLLMRSVEATGERLGIDAARWARLVQPFLKKPEVLLAELMGPLRIPRAPLLQARFGWYGLRSARGLARGLFKSEEARALFAGCAAHSVLPLERMVSAAVGLVFAITGHVVDWPCARGGSEAIAKALVSKLQSLGGRIECNRRVLSYSELPAHKAVLLDTDPRQAASIYEDRLPARYKQRLRRYRMGPGTFKVDWALDGPIPWTDSAVANASTVHVGGTLDEICASESDAWHGRVSARPFLIVCQQSTLDNLRAPIGKHTGYAYCHVPAGCDVDMTQSIEAQIERFAPGFRDRILARHTTAPDDFVRHNPNYVGGAVTGGVADLTQLFTRPVARLNPYTTPDPALFLCSASTPPGGGVHGMCGHFAARAALKSRLR